MPSAVAYSTVTSSAETVLRVSVNTRLALPASPSATLVSAADKPGAASSSVIVPVAVALAMEPADTLTMATNRNSSASSITSSRTAMLTVALSMPAGMVTAPALATKSELG